MTCSAQVAMSIIVVVPDTFETVRKTVSHLRAQSAKARIELVFVAPAIQSLCLPSAELHGFAGVCLVEIDAIQSVGHAKAAGIERASAPIVAFAEDHSYPEPGWAEALIEACQGRTGAAGPVLVNANPGSAVSWASMYLDFGPTIEPASGGEVDRLPWHNTSYRRDLLLAYDSELPVMLNVEGILHVDLKRKGFALYLEPDARTLHLNISLVPSFVREQFYGGRLFSATQVKHYRWSAMQRFVRVAGAPIVPLLRLRRSIRDVVRSGRGRLLLRIAPLMILGLVVHTVGELIGYVFGTGDALQQRIVLE
jgi:hypothetical protein